MLRKRRALRRRAMRRLHGWRKMSRIMVVSLLFFYVVLEVLIYSTSCSTQFYLWYLLSDGCYKPLWVPTDNLQLWGTWQAYWRDAATFGYAQWRRLMDGCEFKPFTRYAIYSLITCASRRLSKPEQRPLSTKSRQIMNMRHMLNLSWPFNLGWNGKDPITATSLPSSDFRSWARLPDCRIYQLRFDLADSDRRPEEIPSKFDSGATIATGCANDIPSSTGVLSGGCRRLLFVHRSVSTKCPKPARS